MSESNSEGTSSFVVKVWWINLARGVIAIALGISLLLNPDEAKAAVLRYMGLYWLTSGVLSLLWGASRARVPELWLAIGLAELFGGGLILLNPWFAIFDAVTAEHLFGLIALITGLLHIIAGMVVRHRHGPGWSLSNSKYGDSIGNRPSEWPVFRAVLPLAARERHFIGKPRRRLDNNKSY